MDEMQRMRTRMAGDLHALAAARDASDGCTAPDDTSKSLTGGEKITVAVIGVPLAAGFLWLVHTYAPTVFGIGVIIAIIAAIAFIWHTVGEAVRRS